MQWEQQCEILQSLPYGQLPFCLLYRMQWEKCGQFFGSGWEGVGMSGLRGGGRRKP